MHSSWTGDTDDGYDVGLLRLDRKPNAALPGIDTHRTPISSGEVLTALGCGKTESQQTADTLQMAQNLHYVSPVRCERTLGNIFKGHMMCAGLLNEDTCNGAPSLSLSFVQVIAESLLCPCSQEILEALSSSPTGLMAT